MSLKRTPLSQLSLRGLAGGALIGALVATGMGTAAGAQGLGAFNTNLPVSVGADRVELQDRENRVLLSGNVVITQGDLRLTAARTTIAFTDAGGLTIQRLDASGGVVVTRGDERAVGEAGVYDFNRKVIVLSGGVALRRGSDSLNGGRLVIDLNTGMSSVDGAGGQANTAEGEPRPASGRVSGTFAVPQSGAR